MSNSLFSKVVTIIAGILMVIVGIMVFRYPLSALVSLALFFGIAIFAVGIMHIVAYFTNKEFFSSPGWLLVQGILDIIIGILLLSNVGITAASLPYILGFWMMFTGINRFVVAFDLKKLGVKNWVFMLIAGILYVILSILIIFHPALGAAFIVAYIAVFMIFYGIMIVLETFAFKK